MCIKELCLRRVGSDIIDYNSLSVYASVYSVHQDETFFHSIKSGHFENQ